MRDVSLNPVTTSLETLEDDLDMDFENETLSDDSEIACFSKVGR